MSAIATATRRHREVSSGDLPLIGATPDRHRTVTLSDELPGADWILGIAKRAQERVMSQKEAVLTMGMDKGQYIRQCQGDGHLSLRRLGVLGEDYWRAFYDELAEHFGWKDDAEQLERALEIQRAAAARIEQLTRKLMQR